jgi:hypothetical protein
MVPENSTPDFGTLTKHSITDDYTVLGNPGLKEIPYLLLEYFLWKSDKGYPLKSLSGLVPSAF